MKYLTPEVNLLTYELQKVVFAASPDTDFISGWTTEEEWVTEK